MNSLKSGIGSNMIVEEKIRQAGVTQWLVCQLPKLVTTVRFRSPAPVLILIVLLAGCRTAQAPYTFDIKPVGGVYHYVKGGETLWSISNLYDVDMGAIIKSNNLENARDIQRGQRLVIPGIKNKEYAPKPLANNTFFAWPLNGNVISYFGSKSDRTKNKGIDIRADEGANVRAARAGRVVFCDEWLKGFGKTVILDHGDNLQTVYAYNSVILAKLGDAVDQSTVIAKVGTSGRAKEPSLHFEIRRNGVPQNPFYYLSR